jgi:hypothetical protein
MFIYCYDPLGHAVKPLVDVLLQQWEIAVKNAGSARRDLRIFESGI